ncbi:endopeptidase La [Desulfobotulus mexicanus]|uniref:Lon protease n=1 Tax=Desulfobotulus mexicanus TaxID=2586642 RepID=A0A5S5MEL7_9BACT|nr:endopeptidase La [Desulfobotulus mexicanus]TYT74162.1 endopeptidase La [Desulfobotulus mexicanus]
MQEQQPSLELSQEKLPARLPILPLHDVVLFPKMVLPLIVRQEQSIRLIDEVMGKDRMVGFVAVKKNKGNTFTTPDELYEMGCGAIILKMAKGEDNKTQLLVQGISRFTINEYQSETPYLVAGIKQIEEPETKSKEIDALMSNLMDLYIQIVELSPGLPQEMLQMAKTIDEPGILADMVTSTINTTHEEKQKILEITDLKKRLREVTKIVNYQLEILKIGSKIQTQVKEDMGQKQKEFYLRQQLKAIRDELGETDESTVEVDDYRAKIAEKNLTDEARKEADRELKRLSRMHPSSAEYNVVTTYLDWMISLPWNNSTEDTIDIKKARKILDDDHYGLEKAKKRILEYLAVRKLKPDSKGPIICFAGPPGTGKTSLGRSIAKALGREFVRMALGGVRDEAEIRGHRRTYVGALPGRIIQALRRAGTDNPVFILDEVDKLGNDFRGDPSSALLEVLDPEQNNSFVDHYLDVSFDLSKVMFITTANVIHTIPPALRDRMEVIDLSGYTLDEKIKISNKYLIPRQRKAHGITSSQITFTNGAVRHIIEDYTREAGLRNLEREIASLCRGVASRIAEGETETVSINVMNIPRYLGPKKIHNEVNTNIKVPGVAVGLAWTPAGGDVLVVETKAMKGKGKLTLTGQLGDVMKESVSAAMSFIRSDAAQLNIPEDFFEKNDLHIHVPAGAIPKDGPSAGVTMLTAITSLATQRKLIPNLAMTGEITLRGEVLPVGGIKEKVLAAHRAGMKTLILPKWNEKDIDEIPKKIKKEIQFHFVDKMMDVLNIALEQETTDKINVLKEKKTVAKKTKKMDIV